MVRPSPDDPAERDLNRPPAAQAKTKSTTAHKADFRVRGLGCSGPVQSSKRSDVMAPKFFHPADVGNSALKEPEIEPHRATTSLNQ